jgi:hypothetical protein
VMAMITDDSTSRGLGAFQPTLLRDGDAGGVPNSVLIAVRPFSS